MGLQNAHRKGILLSRGQQNSYVTRRNNSREMAKGCLRDSQERIPPKAPWGLAWHTGRKGRQFLVQ